MKASWIVQVVIVALACVSISCTGPRAGVDRAPSAPPIRAEDLVKVDPSRAVKQADSDLLWYDARELVIEGKGWTDTDGFYTRLPARAQQTVTKAVWERSQWTAGLAVRFVTDSTRIAATWDGGGGMNHMAATGNSGLDLYIRRDGGWEFRGVGVPQPKRTTVVLAKDLPNTASEYLLYLPLYSKVTDLRIGVEPVSLLAKAPPRPQGKAQPIVFYGTSITQGGCASRAGMCHTAILGRWLDRAVINLGFSGSGKMEPAMAELLGELDAAVYVLECLPNMTTEMVRERVQPFVQALRESKPNTPILLVENPCKAAENPGNQALREVYADLLKAGVQNLHYLAGEPQLAGTENGTVDGVHPTDLGFYRMAMAYRPLLEQLLASDR